MLSRYGVTITLREKMFLLEAFGTQYDEEGKLDKSGNFIAVEAIIKARDQTRGRAVRELIDLEEEDAALAVQAKLAGKSPVDETLLVSLALADTSGW